VSPLSPAVPFSLDVYVLGIFDSPFSLYEVFSIAAVLSLVRLLSHAAAEEVVTVLAFAQSPSLFLIIFSLNPNPDQ